MLFCEDDCYDYGARDLQPITHVTVAQPSKSNRF